MKWTPNTVLEAIHLRKAHGKNLNYSAVVADDEKLAGAARRYFGTWQAAIEAAGLDYSKILRPRQSVNPRGTWSPQRVVEDILERVRNGKPMAAHLVQRDDPRLCAAAVYHLGSWEVSITRAGLDYVQIRLTEEWTPGRVISIIQDLHAADEDLSENMACDCRSALYGAAETHFGGWKEAIESAGLDYTTVRRTDAWSRERVLDRLRELARTGPASTKNLRLTEYQAVTRYFGGLPAALRAAGLDPNEHLLGHGKWDPDAVIRRLRERLAAGLPCNDNALKRADVRLWGAAKKYFGTVARAVEAAQREVIDGE